MIPEIDMTIQNVKLSNQPTKTYAIVGDKIVGMIDDVEAIRQAIYLTLSVERYDYLIYSWSYGVELKELIGKNIAFAYPEIKRRIIEALIQDDRILDVDDFTFRREEESVLVNFTVHTIYGDLLEEMGVMN
ncbi:MAG TPA: DUF2634 domain-containing protein [Lachnoclostridium phytofermentans]|uniref:DUF2634 domain-containing protein n=1 Tax=Lachnoclostridium phytofermentans TaxID=66219 RepID=A0A3D2XAX6_9FIRM|nr:DUF2634 domain-containing protein [Lachnoclostridium sp.]HCL03498.1 DUF2634 domain-containing protein [Lachnoclostridium phytofermentans]